MTKFPDLLRESGYHVRRSLKTISFTASPPSPAERDAPNTEYKRYGLYVSEATSREEQTRQIEETLNHPRNEMRRVLQASKHEKQPFFFIYGTINVHRPYAPDSGKKLWGIEPDSLQGLIPKFLPDVHDVRRDFADYLGEVQAADAMFGTMLDELEKAGELKNTIIILTGDNGIPGIPRGKTNCYDLSVQAPMLIRWPGQISAGRTVEDFVSVMDVGPTLLDLAGVPIPDTMHGRSFLRQLKSQESGWIDSQRDHVIVGRELHFHSARAGNLPYPMRAIRTRDYLYIRNFKPGRWPNGAPFNIDDLQAAADYGRLAEGPYRDLDASLTKTWLLENRHTNTGMRFVKLTLGKRPPEELYDVRQDPDQMNNLADSQQHSAIKAQLSKRLMEVLQTTSDPRLQDAFDHAPYVVTNQSK